MRAHACFLECASTQTIWSYRWLIFNAKVAWAPGALLRRIGSLHMAGLAVSDSPLGPSSKLFLFAFTFGAHVCVSLLTSQARLGQQAGDSTCVYIYIHRHIHIERKMYIMTCISIYIYTMYPCRVDRLGEALPQTSWATHSAGQQLEGARVACRRKKRKFGKLR